MSRKNYTSDPRNKQQLSETVKLYPNAKEKQMLQSYCGLRRFWYNQAINLNQKMYYEYSAHRRFYGYLFKPKKKCKKDKLKVTCHRLYAADVNYPYPSFYTVRNELRKQRTKYDLSFASHTPDLAIQDAVNAIEKHANNPKEDGLPKYKKPTDLKQSFKTDQAKIIQGKYLILPKPRGFKGKVNPIKMSSLRKQFLHLPLKEADITCLNSQWQANLHFNAPSIALKPNSFITGVDVNIKQIDYLDRLGHRKYETVLPANALHIYSKIRAYQRQLAKKSKGSHNYQQKKVKLELVYRKMKHIQHDIVDKLCIKLIRDFSIIVIEDLAVKKMQMTKKVKSLHRALFGYFKARMVQLGQEYQRQVILADQMYPSTQRCSRCGWVKRNTEKVGLTGNKKHHTGHSQYICYHCGLHINRDYNACLNLLEYYFLQIKDPAYLKRIIETQAVN